ncbi:helix-turn-helix domain-containing protein [Streptomyces nigra]|uniref:helix-turn-helix domain-containing protein n=1 Tax=Streptomyces nigra TaxID=1827580 RepID=UPI0030CB24AE
MAAMSREVRRIVVAHLASLNMDPAQIAAELGVSRETVRRDLLNPPPPAPAPAGPDVAAAEADASTLVLLLDEPLHTSLTVLRQTCNGPDTEAQNVASARAAIHAMADHFRDQA